MAHGFSNSAYPLVSAVIPTRGRPELLACAVRSALQQTWPNFEVVVVIDGPDPATAARLAAFADPRVRVVQLGSICGTGDARNAGVRASHGEWISFLDEDDEWLAGKIERQMRTAHSSPDWFPVVTTRVIARSATRNRVLPLKPYQSSQPIADFLFCREGLRNPGGVMPCSTLLAPRELLLAVPFQPGLPMHQDWDWLIRVVSHKGVSLAMVREPLVLWRVDDDPDLPDRTSDWEFSLAWIRSVRPLISRRAFSWFVAVECARRAQASCTGLASRLRLLRAFLLEGEPELRSLLSLILFSLVPRQIRRAMRKGILFHHQPANVNRGLHLVYSRPPAPPIFRKSSR